MFDDTIFGSQQPEPQETTTDVEEQPQEETTEGQELPQQPKKVDPASSFKALREKAERIERERDEAIYRLQQFESQKQQQSESNDEDFNLGPDDIAEGKHLSKVSKKIQKLENQLKQYEQKSQTQSTESRIKSQFPDFDRVVSKDNIELLNQQYPEIANTLRNSQDLYSTAVSAYTLIKQFGIHQDDLYERDRIMAQKNAAKPKPVASVNPQHGESPLSRANAFANGLTDDLKAQLNKEMIEAMKNR